MRKFIIPVISVIALSTLLFSCKRNTDTVTGEGHGYFHYEVGKYIIYNVDSVYWDDFLQTAVHRSSQVRYDIADTFRDASDRLSYRINVSNRIETVKPFEPTEVFYVTPTEVNVEVTQRNLTFIKGIFPITEGKTWNGNAMIPIEDEQYAAEYNNSNWLYTYHNVGRPFDPGNNYYDKTVTVNQIDDQLNNPDVDSTAYAYRNYSQEVYAHGVGLVFKERVYWVFQPKPGGSGFRKGYEVRMRAIENN